MNEKKYIDVIVRFDATGNKIPKSIILENGRQIEIDKVLDTRFCASLKVGGLGERYTVKICGKTIYLFCEKNLWYVENLSL